MNTIEFFNNITDEDRERLEKCKDVLIEIFSENISIGDNTCDRLLRACEEDSADDIKYYESVMKQCNRIMALACGVFNIPDPTEGLDS